MKDEVPLQPFQGDFTPNVRYEPSYVGLTFKVVYFPITLFKLGVSSSLLELMAERPPDEKKKVVVLIKNRLTGETLGQVEFTGDDFKPRTDYVYRRLNKDLYLERGFEGVLRLKYGRRLANEGLLPAACPVRYKRPFGDDGLFFYTGLVSHQLPLPLAFTERACPLANFEYTMNDVVEVRQHLGARSTQNLAEV